MRLAPLRPLETTWEDWVLGGGAKARFADPSLPLCVEVGPGDDVFLLERALAEPDRNWLGIEYSRKRLRRYVRRALRRAGAVGNLRLIWRPAGDLVAPFLSPSRVTAYHVYFPDPWPKAHHARYRLFQPALARALGDSLVGGGEIRVATDDEPYAREIDEVLSTSGLARIPPQQDPRTTPFEERFRAEGRPIHTLWFRRADLSHGTLPSPADGT